MLESGFEPALAGVVIAVSVPHRVPERRPASPLRQAERRLHPWVALVVVPLFAFFNAGVPLGGDAFGQVFSAAPLGIILGLALGKPIGVVGAAWIATRYGVAELPDDVDWGWVCGAGMLCGVGFTMSLFVAALSFTDTASLDAARLAVLIGSAASAALGLACLKMRRDRPRGMRRWMPPSALSR